MHVAITAEEILTFFPNHTIWHLCTNRLINNGWTRNGVVAYKNYARSLTGEQGFLPTTFAGQITTADKAIYGKHQKKGESVRTPVDDLTPSWWASNPNSAPQNKVDYELAALAKGVVNWPQGPGRGPLTDCVEYACQQAEVVAFRISDVDEMTRDMDFNTIHAPSGHLDGNAARRHEKILNDLKWKDPRNELGKERDRRKRKRDSETPNGEQQDQGRQQKSRKKIPLHDRLQPQEKILTFK